MVIEGANSPTTPTADEILADNGDPVIPDVMANAGGVVVSYFEWVQNLQHFRWDEREVNDKLGTIMRRAYREVVARAKEEDGVPLRVAAYELGIERVLEAARARGYIVSGRCRFNADSAPGRGALPRRPCPPTASPGSGTSSGAVRQREFGLARAQLNLLAARTGRSVRRLQQDGALDDDRRVAADAHAVALDRSTRGRSDGPSRRPGRCPGARCRARACR